MLVYSHTVDPMNLLLATIQIKLALKRWIAAWEVWLIVDNGVSPDTLVVS